MNKSQGLNPIGTFHWFQMFVGRPSIAFTLTVLADSSMGTESFLALMFGSDGTQPLCLALSPIGRKSRMDEWTGWTGWYVVHILCVWIYNASLGSSPEPRNYVLQRVSLQRTSDITSNLCSISVSCVHPGNSYQWRFWSGWPQAARAPSRPQQFQPGCRNLYQYIAVPQR